MEKELEMIDPVSLRKIKLTERLLVGIYFLWYEDELVYIGQSVNIENRVKQHLYDKYFDCYSYVAVEEKDLDRAELNYIEKYKPFYNIDLNFNAINVRSYYLNEDKSKLYFRIHSRKYIFKRCDTYIIDYNGEIVGEVKDRIGYIRIDRCNYIFKNLKIEEDRTYKLRFGQYKNKNLKIIPSSYLLWVYKNIKTNYADKKEIRIELKNRGCNI